MNGSLLGLDIRERRGEFIVPAEDVAELWDQLLAAEVRPVGLGAQDTLRLEAGMNLYGQDMDSPPRQLFPTWPGLLPLNPPTVISSASGSY